jgi:hypothetical protein
MLVAIILSVNLGKISAFFSYFLSLSSWEIITSRDEFFTQEFIYLTQDDTLQEKFNPRMNIALV